MASGLIIGNGFPVMKFGTEFLRINN
jgi:hypothetical protein